MASYDPENPAPDSVIPFIVDLAMFDGGLLHDFIDDRGWLLPPEELTLARTWLGTPLVQWEVVDLDPGATLTLRNTRTGDTLTVTERTASKVLQQGELLLARVVTAGSEHQIVGLPLDVHLRSRAGLMELLDTEPEAEDFALWMAGTFAPPRMSNREGEDMMLCSATLRPPPTSWEHLAGLLDTRYGAAQDGQWTETVEIDGDSVVRSTLRRQRNDLIVEANSNARFDRVLTTLLDEFTVDFTIVDEERLSPTAALEQEPDLSDAWDADDLLELTDEMRANLAEIIQGKEALWLDEEIPALSGLTPRQAADDPTRREDLIALLNEFDRYEELPPGAMTFNAARLRKELGL